MAYRRLKIRNNNNLILISRYQRVRPYTKVVYCLLHTLKHEIDIIEK